MSYDAKEDKVILTPLGQFRNTHNQFLKLNHDLYNAKTLRGIFALEAGDTKTRSHDPGGDPQGGGERTLLLRPPHRPALFG